MRLIKFRGKTFGGEIVFGNYFFDSGNDKSYIGELDFFDEVEPESVAQLVGYDADGNEVYDDDVLIDEKGVKWEIDTNPQVEMYIGGVYDYLYNPKHKFKLKK